MGLLVTPVNWASLEGIIKSAKNKLKGRVGDDDLQTLQRAVGHTDEGNYLVDLVRQSNSLTDLFNNGLKGGVSRYTDIFNPLARHGNENSFQSSTPELSPRFGPKLAELTLRYTITQPLALALQFHIVAAGRGIDALTGRRSTVAKFVAPTMQGTPTHRLHRVRSGSIRRRQALDEASAIKHAEQQANDQLVSSSVKPFFGTRTFRTTTLE
jgi:hypothetical protein